MRPIRVGQNGLFVLAPTLFAHGTAEQRARILPPMARADEVWAQAWSEPDAGSDLAAIAVARRADRRRLAAVRPEDVEFARRCSPTGRSACSAPIPDAERHRGLTYFMFDLRADGVTVRPIPQLDGEAGFAEIFLDDVFVPDADVIGEPGQGWRVAMSSAGTSGACRCAALADSSRPPAMRLIDLWQRYGDPADTAHGQPGSRRLDRRTRISAARLSPASKSVPAAGRRSPGGARVRSQP